jgi:hypothetical protein
MIGIAGEGIRLNKPRGQGARVQAGRQPGPNPAPARRLAPGDAHSILIIESLRTCPSPHNASTKCSHGTSSPHHLPRLPSIHRRLLSRPAPVDAHASRRRRVPSLHSSITSSAPRSSFDSATDHLHRAADDTTASERAAMRDQLCLDIPIYI